MAKITKKRAGELQKEHPKGKLITVGFEKDEDGKVLNEGKDFFLSKPGRGTIKFAMSQSMTAQGKIDAISPGEVVMNKCWVEGDESVKEDDKYWFRACMDANEYLNEVTGFL